MKKQTSTNENPNLHRWYMGVLGRTSTWNGDCHTLARSYPQY